MAPTRSSGQGAKRKRKARKTRFSTTPKKVAPQPVAAKQKTSRKRSSQAQEESTSSRRDISRRETTSSRRTAPHIEAPKGRKRKAREADLDELAAESRSAPKYVQLAPARKRIPQEIIDGWPEASPQLLEGISTVLRDARKTIAHGRDSDSKIKEAEDGLNALIRALELKLSSVKIPPMAKDFQFNVDKLTERNTILGAEVTSARHANQLLKEQSQVAQRLLKKDEENLEKLKKDVKEWKKEWKYQQRRVQLHPLLQNSEDTEIEGDGPDDIGLKTAAPIDTSMLDAPDSELAPLVEQLRRSLGNMQGNQAQVDGIDDAMRNARVALDDMLFKHTSAQQYGAL
ncbi:hypothetical protein K505DRAFT_403863 [Melanomma pulvis-pyrius CBS 109.77]|uniref:CENP-Q, a CENPA-CAD centromere complex subunit-domain-containing protein n=1 Tax=Melanomma pulvis-pyrius CBS 109.77 TaxID=1314802 RepID=A0A6A6XW64_9PLEO|nr:hypothetical protein K505DRAFT_403863 [Melanomma pulvis-pyrius CBS 109.77]